MICASCGVESAAIESTCASCAEPTAVAGRYRLDQVIGRGAMGTTYRATRLADAHLVCVKELAYNRLASFDVEARFQRESAVLRQLAHRQIPRYVDDLAHGEGKARSLYLVQELVIGQTLADELGSRRYREEEVLDIVAELADVLAYLHRLSPPVIHRDLKPANVIRRGPGTPDAGTLVLVDFGAVKDVLKESVVGASVVGTFGYMPPEQLWGKALPASDLYSLGVLAVALLSRREPLELVGDDRVLEWRTHVKVGAETEALLGSLLATEVADRADDAAAVAERARAIAAALRLPRADVAAPTTGTPPAPAAAPDRQALVQPADGDGEPAPRRSRGIFIAGALLAIASLLGFVLASKSSSPPLIARAAQAVPDGLFGLRSGMNVTAAREARPELASAQVEPGKSFMGTSGHMPTIIGGLIQMPGSRLQVQMIVAGEPTPCSFEFAVDDGLSKIECEIEKQATRADVIALEARVLVDLEARYKLSTEGGCPKRDSMSFGYDRTCRWSDDHAEIEVHTKWNDGMNMLPDRGQLTVTWLTFAHTALVERLEGAHAADMEAQRRAQAAAAEAERKLEIERLRRLAPDSHGL